MNLVIPTIFMLLALASPRYPTQCDREPESISVEPTTSYLPFPETHPRLPIPTGAL